MAAVTELSARSIVNNTATSTNKIKLVFKNGVISGNIITPPPPEPVIVCAENGLDFTCPDNSQYIGAI